MFLEPMLLGRYPVDLAAAARGRRPSRATWPTIRQPLDFYGVNYYNPMQVAAAPEDAEMPFEFRDVARLPDDRLRLAGRARRAARVADHVPRPLPRRAAADHDHRVRLRLQHGPGRGRRRRRPAAHRLPRRPPARGRRRDPARRRRPRLLLLVAAGQLRVGRGLHPALRPGARRLRDPGAHPEALLRLVRRPDRRPAQGAASAAG